MIESRILTCLSCGQGNRIPADRLNQAPRCGTCGAALLPGRPVEVEFATLSKAARTDQIPLLVDFWAPWCGPCRMMAPEFDKAAGLLKTQARLAKIDTERSPDAASRWNIRGIPAFILFNGGRETARLTGARSARELADWVREEI